jgi:hypothetical protein
MRKKCSKALKNKVLKITNELYDGCVRTVFGLSDLTPTEEAKVLLDFAKINKAAAILGLVDDEEIESLMAKKEEVSDLYLQRMCQLPTKSLLEIIKGHELEGGIRRAPKTIEMILSELARRELFSDSNESDFKEHNGDVDGHSKKSKRSRKKAARKRHKTSKNR